MFGDKYPSRFHLMISLLNGAVARNQALNASLRQFNPDFLHIPDSKFFWHGFPNVSQLWDNEVELLRFETSEINPPVDLAELDTDGRLLVLEMIKHKAKLEEAVLSSLPSTPRSGKRSNVAPDSTRVTPLEKQKKQHKQNELESFWLRKTKQPVLSVLMTQKEGEASPKFYCGINIEVSMPTGSLCAERSAIGNALATDPTLRRSDMKMIAVLSMTLNPAELISDSDEDEMKISLSPSLLKSYSVDSSPLVQTKPKRSALNPIAPCGACKEWLKKIAAVNPDFRVLMFTDWDCRKVIVKPII
jgi:cytidine deaminase